MAAAAGRNLLFQKKTWIGAAVVAGVLVGINFPEFWKGPGIGGGTSGTGAGTPTANAPETTNPNSENSEVAAVARKILAENASTTDQQSTTAENAATSATIEKPAVVKVVVAERAFTLRSENGERPIQLPEIIDLVKQAPGDIDGIRLRIYRKQTSRASAEDALGTALTDAGIREDVVEWVPTSTD